MKNEHVFQRLVLYRSCAGFRCFVLCSFLEYSGLILLQLETGAKLGGHIMHTLNRPFLLSYAHGSCP